MILVLFYFSVTMSVSERKFILDCDAGTDDAQALMMVLSEPSVKLVAVLTVYGNASCENTARNCLRILKFKNRLDVGVSYAFSIFS